MIAFITKYRYALIVIACLAAFNIWSALKVNEGEKKADTKHELADTKADNAATAAQVKTREKQNEIILRDITPVMLDNVLREGRF